MNQSGVLMMRFVQLQCRIIKNLIFFHIKRCNYGCINGGMTFAVKCDVRGPFSSRTV